MNSSRYISFLSSFHSFFCGEFSLFSSLIAQKCSFSWQWPPHTSLSCPNPSISFTASRLHLLTRSLSLTHSHTSLSDSFTQPQHGPGALCVQERPLRPGEEVQESMWNLSTCYGIFLRNSEGWVESSSSIVPKEMWETWNVGDQQNCQQKRCGSTLSQQEVCLWKF